MKIKFLITAIAVLFALTFCMASCSKDDETTSTQNNDNGNINPSTTKMKITIGTAVFTATLYDNPSANVFKASLPLSINMTELNGNEKYYDLPNPLPTNPSAGGDLKVGDLMLYGNNVLVLFYKNLNTTYNYTKLGYLDNPNGLASALGAGNITVKFEIN
jgi:hypothetical protein